MRGDRLIGAAGVLIGLSAAVEGWRLPAPIETGEPGTRLFPLVLGAIITILSALVALRPAPDPAPTTDPGGAGRLWGTVAVAVGYAVAFERLGFLLATPLALVALLASYGERRWIVLAGVSIGATAATYLVFARWLGAPLPLGLLGS